MPQSKHTHCITPFCRGKVQTGAYCYKCRKRIYRETYPEKAVYQTLKDNAKRRNKEFSLTFEQFLSIAIPTEYMTKRGKTRTSLSIDRDKNYLGYTVDNCRVIPLGANTVKRNTLDYNFQEKRARYVSHSSQSEPIDTPF